MNQSPAKPDAIRQIVRDTYGKIANTFGSCCNTKSKTRCCADANTSAAQIGYTRVQIDSMPDTANMGLGCGNPQAIARLKPGETVLDLGSGAGFDCMLAARSVGPAGHVIGVDMTDPMIRKARRNARRAGIENVEFRAGEIEHLPVADNSVDVVISNCVVNLSLEKEAVFQEAFRVLKPGGRLAISDVVAVRPLPVSMQNDPGLHCACIGGAAAVDDLEHILGTSGFEGILITPLDQSRDLIQQWVPDKNAQDYVVSATIDAFKPE